VGRARGANRVVVAAALVMSVAGCPSGETPAADGGVRPAPSPEAAPQVVVRGDGPTFTPSKANDPVGKVTALMRTESGGHCVQFRSVKGLAAAQVLQQRIESEARLPVSLLKADLGDRGLWYRICAGNEPTHDAATKKAKGWTSAGGKLSPYMEPVAPGHAAFFIKRRPTKPKWTPTEAQARLLLAAHPDGGRPIRKVRTAHDGVMAAAVSALPQGTHGPSVLVVDHLGRQMPLSGAPGSLGCPPCESALGESKVIRRVLVGAFDVGPWPGDELVVEEGTEDGASVLSVFRQRVHTDGPGSFSRQASMWLGTQQPRLQLLAQAKPVEADGDPDKEIAVLITELPLLDGRLCGLRHRADIYDLTPKSPRKLDTGYAAAMASATGAADGSGATKLLSLAYDKSRDYLTASRICASFLSRSHNPDLAQHCIQRIQRLRKAGRNIEAVNAAGALAEANPALRPAVALPFYQAVKHLNDDVRLTVHDDNCVDNPLLEDFDKRPVGQAIRMAKVRAKDRKNLAEVADAVFVTGVRDFGPKTPAGRIVQGWLDRLKVALPARYAAIDALLATAPAVQAPPPEKKVEPKGRPPIILQVHDDPELP